MQSKSAKYYLSRLIKAGHQWQYTDVNGIESKPKLYFTRIQWFIISATLIISYFMENGFSDDFVGYIISALSIFVGLFLTLIISVFDKFQKLNLKELKDKENKGEIVISAKIKTSLIQRKNYFKQFSSLTSYSIIISIFCIFLLSISLLTDFFKLNLTEFVFAEKITTKSIILFFKLSAVYVYRLVILYLLTNFLLIVIYAVTSIYNLFIMELDEVKLS